MVLPAVMAGVGLAISGASAIYNMVRGTEDYKGASSEQRSQAGQLAAGADVLQARGGMTETEYSRALEAITQTGSGIASQSTGMAREAMISPIVAERITKDAMAKLTAYYGKSMDQLTATDIAVRRDNEEKALAMRKAAYAAEAGITEADRQAKYLTDRAYQKMLGNVANLASGITLAGVKLYTASQGDEQPEKKTPEQETPEQETEAEMSPTHDEMPKRNLPFISPRLF